MRVEITLMTCNGCNLAEQLNYMWFRARSIQFVNPGAYILQRRNIHNVICNHRCRRLFRIVIST